MGDARETSSPAPNYNTPVKDLAYKDLLTSTFTLASHDRGIKTWCVPATYPECVYCGKRYRYERFNVECHMDPNIGKATGRERTVAPCKESLPTSRGPHRKRFLEVQAEIRAHMASDKNTLLQEAAASAKRKLISVGGCADTPLDLAAGGNADGKRPCLGNGQTVLMKTPTQAEFVECWSEAIIRNGLPPALVDDPLFRKALVTTSRMGQTAVCMGKGTALGKRDTTLPHRHTFTRKIIPATDKRLDEENMARLKSKMKKIGGTIMSDGWQSTTSRPIINVILGVDGMLTLRLATDCSGKDKTMEFICDLLCQVIEELGPSNIFSVVMDGACKGAFPLIRAKYRGCWGLQAGDSVVHNLSWYTY